MTHDELDRILSSNDDLAPSSGFVTSVMDAVRQEASTPAPIPFPWRRALPGIVAAAVTVISVLTFFSLQLRHLDPIATAPMQFSVSGSSSILIAITAALLLTFASIMFSRRLTSN